MRKRSFDGSVASLTYLPKRAEAAFRLDANEYNDRTRVQLQVEYAQGV